MLFFFLLMMISFEGVLIYVIVKKTLGPPVATWDPNTWKLILIVTTQVLTSGTVAALGGAGAIDFRSENASAWAAGAGVVWCIILFILGYTPWVEFIHPPPEGPKPLPVDNIKTFLFDAWLEANEHLRPLFTGRNEEYCIKDLFISVFFKSRNKNKLERPTLTTVFLYKRYKPKGGAASSSSADPNETKLCMVKFQLLRGTRPGAATHLFQVASPTMPTQSPVRSALLWRVPGQGIQILPPPADGETWHLVGSARVEALTVAYYPPECLPLSADYMWIETPKYALDYAELVEVVVVSDRELVVGDGRRPTLWEVGPAFEHPRAPPDETAPAYLKRLTSATVVQKPLLREIKDWLDLLPTLKGIEHLTALTDLREAIRRATGEEFGGLLTPDGTTQGGAAVMRASGVKNPLLATYAWQPPSTEGGKK